MTKSGLGISLEDRAQPFIVNDGMEFRGFQNMGCNVVLMTHVAHLWQKDANEEELIIVEYLQHLRIMVLDGHYKCFTFCSP